MLTTIALVVVTCSIIVLFSQEIMRVLKKFFSIPGVAIFIPLILASLLVVYYDPWSHWWLHKAKQGLHQLALLLSTWIAFAEPAELLAIIIIMTLFSMIPLLIARFASRKIKTKQAFPYATIISVILWVMIAILYTVSYSYSIY